MEATGGGTLSVSGITLTQISSGQLTAAGGADCDELGWSVGVSDDTVAAGAWTVPAGGGYGAGAVYVFTKPTSGWADETQATKLTGPAGAPEDALEIED